MKADINYDFKNSKSLKIYPRKNRKSLRDISGATELLSRKALNTSENEVKHLIDVANRRLEKINALITESVKDGHHLVDTLFIPEYLGFINISPEKDDDIRIFSKDGFNITRLPDEKWLMLHPEKPKMVLRIRNMYEAILVLGSIGMDLNVKTYLNGGYSEEKPLEEVIDAVIKKIMDNRKKDLTKSAG